MAGVGPLGDKASAVPIAGGDQVAKPTGAGSAAQVEAEQGLVAQRQSGDPGDGVDNTGRHRVISAPLNQPYAAVFATRQESPKLEYAAAVRRENPDLASALARMPITAGPILDTWTNRFA